MSLNSDNCYQLLQQIPLGKVSSYKIIAEKMGSKAYRAVGQMIGKNPSAPQVPCHRIVKSDGSLGGYAFGIDKKIELLQAEGIKIKNGKIVDFAKIIHKF
jgi:methylated-DNA-[protein]-cysteine S-methyltransferase